MTSKELFLNAELKCGGFYELAIQVSPSSDNYPIDLYTSYIWSLDNVDGPFDLEFNKTSVNIENYEHNGILRLENFAVPFKTLNIHEREPIETGFNWFDICFYTAAIEHVFGQQYRTWNVTPNPPSILKTFLENTMRELYALYHFRLAIIDFEISGTYYLDYFKSHVENMYNSTFYMGKEQKDEVSDSNLPSIIFLTD